jgi:hypothetical protein
MQPSKVGGTNGPKGLGQKGFPLFGQRNLPCKAAKLASNHISWRIPLMEVDLPREHPFANTLFSNTPPVLGKTEY